MEAAKKDCMVDFVGSDSRPETMIGGLVVWLVGSGISVDVGVSLCTGLQLNESLSSSTAFIGVLDLIDNLGLMFSTPEPCNKGMSRLFPIPTSSCGCAFDVKALVYVISPAVSSAEIVQ